MCLEIQWTPCFMGKLFLLIIKKSIFLWMFAFPSEERSIKNNPSYRKKKVSGIEIRSHYTICFYKPILRFKMSCRGINFSIFSSQNWNWSFSFLFFLNGMNLFKGCHLNTESIKFKHEESLQGFHNAFVSIHCKD